jgi:hypothetical protein
VRLMEKRRPLKKRLVKKLPVSKSASGVAIDAKYW